jgi:hypothetical protein
MKNVKKTKKEIERPVRDYNSKLITAGVSGSILIVASVGAIIYNLVKCYLNG